MPNSKFMQTKANGKWHQKWHEKRLEKILKKMNLFFEKISQNVKSREKHEMKKSPLSGTLLT